MELLYATLAELVGWSDPATAAPLPAIDTVRGDPQRRQTAALACT